MNRLRLVDIPEDEITLATSSVNWTYEGSN